MFQHSVFKGWYFLLLVTKFSSSFYSQNLEIMLWGVIDKLCLLFKVASRSISSSQHESTLYWYTIECQKQNQNFLLQPMESDNDNTLITKLKFRLCWLKAFPELTSYSEETCEAAQFWTYAKHSSRPQVLIIWGLKIWVPLKSPNTKQNSEETGGLPPLSNPISEIYWERSFRDSSLKQRNKPQSS